MATEPSEQVGTRMMFENERVRVWDLSLAPGESLEKHIHRNDYFFIVQQGGLIRFSNPDDPSEFRDVQFEDDQITFREVGRLGKIDNRLTNIGSKHHRNFVIELIRG